VLSSGFLAFARHVGFIEGCNDCNILPQRIIGTSSGSLAGSLWASGLSATQIYAELGCKAPIQLISPSFKLHRGLFSLRGLIRHLKTILPKDFSQLEIPLAVGVFGSSGDFELITSGNLPEAVVSYSN
jgi:NTE family protein